MWVVLSSLRQYCPNNNSCGNVESSKRVNNVCISYADAAADDFDDMDMVDDFDAEQGMTEEEEEVRFIPEQDDASIVFTKHTGN